MELGWVGAVGGYIGRLILGLVWLCHVVGLRCRSLPPSSLLSVNQGMIC